MLFVHDHLPQRIEVVIAHTYMYCPSTYRVLCCRLTSEGVQSSRQTTRRHENTDGSRECSRRHLPACMYPPVSRLHQSYTRADRQTDSINLPPTITSIDNTHHTSTNAEDPKASRFSRGNSYTYTSPKKKKKKERKKESIESTIYLTQGTIPHCHSASSDTLKEKKKERDRGKKKRKAYSQE